MFPILCFVDRTVVLIAHICDQTECLHFEIKKNNTKQTKMKALSSEFRVKEP